MNDNPTSREIGRRLHEFSSKGEGLSVRLDGSLPETGYAVGIPGYEMRLRKSANNDNLVATWAMWAIRQITDSCHGGDTVRRIEQIVLGVWIDDDHIYYDVSRVFPNRIDARRFGDLWNQIAIWNLDKGEEIRL